jgi:hypothetical protein
MRLPQISGEHEAGLDAPRNKTQESAVIKPLREILPQKERRRQRLALGLARDVAVAPNAAELLW